MNINQASLLNTFSGQTNTRPQPSAAKNNDASTPLNVSSNALNQSSVSISTTVESTHSNTYSKPYSKPSITTQDNAPTGTEKKGQETDKAQEKESAIQKITKENESKNNSLQLSEENIKIVQDLKKRDQEVKNHEAAHLAAAGEYATGGASYDYKRGPDGKNYAVGGEVGIDSSPIPNDPQATLQKAQQIRAAAQAPANPSAQDRQVAASATQMETTARQEIVELTNEKPDNPEQLSNQQGNDKKEVSEDNTEKNANQTSGSQNKAASAYQAIGDISQNIKEAASLIEIFA